MCYNFLMIPYEYPSREIAEQVERNNALLLFQNYSETSRLNTDLIVHAIAGRYYSAEERAKILEDENKIQEAIGRFEKEVWYEGGWQEDEQKAQLKSHEMHLGTMETLSYTIAGRTLITLRDETIGAEITVITAENEPPRPDDSGPMGLQSINATAKQAIELLGRMNSYRSANIGMTPSRRVSIADSQMLYTPNSEIIDSE